MGDEPNGVAVTPDGKHVYVANFESLDVSVIDTATDTVVATVATVEPKWIAVTPDGKHVYVPNYASGTVSVIDTATNTVVATVKVAGFPLEMMAWASFRRLRASPSSPSAKLDIAFGPAPNQDSFNLHSSFTLSSTAPGLHPHRDPVTLQVGTFSITIPPDSFREQPNGSFSFAGVIGGVSLKAQIYHTGTLQYAFHAKATGASLTGTKNVVYVTIIGGDSGATSVTAKITP
ncbi:MAG TPA: YncE family protein [Methylocella sp.]|nr:YncE family protein [Methylocella sp.]